MTDREMLELAAKASGMRLLLSLGFTAVDEAFFDEETRLKWDPLEDDGDALRLAVKLNIAVKFHKNAPPELGLPRECATATTDTNRWFAESGADQCTATRRAIVRAAAEIGKGMQ